MSNIFDLFKQIEKKPDTAPVSFIIAGLGNIGKQYERTRHNAGFRIVDEAARKWGVSWKDWHKLGEYGKANVAGSEIFLLKPHTFMNLSGQAVGSLSRFYKIPPKNAPHRRKAQERQGYPAVPAVFGD